MAGSMVKNDYQEIGAQEAERLALFDILEELKATQGQTVIYPEKEGQTTARTLSNIDSQGGADVIGQAQVPTPQDATQARRMKALNHEQEMPRAEIAKVLEHPDEYSNEDLKKVIEAFKSSQGVAEEMKQANFSQANVP